MTGLQGPLQVLAVPVTLLSEMPLNSVPSGIPDLPEVPTKYFDLKVVGKSPLLILNQEGDITIMYIPYCRCTYFKTCSIHLCSSAHYQRCMTEPPAVFTKLLQTNLIMEAEQRFPAQLRLLPRCMEQKKKKKGLRGHDLSNKCCVQTSLLVDKHAQTNLNRHCSGLHYHIVIYQQLSIYFTCLCH